MITSALKPMQIRGIGRRINLVQAEDEGFES